MVEYKNILISYLSESPSLKLLEDALIFGKIMNTKIDVVYILEPLTDRIYYLDVGETEIFPLDYWSATQVKNKDEFKSDLKAILERLSMSANLLEAEGNPAQIIIEKSANYDLVIISSIEESEKSKKLTPIARNVVHSAKCPILVLRDWDIEKRMDSIKNILVPVDGSKVSNIAGAHASYISNKVNGTITLLHVWEKKYEKWLRKITKNKIDISKVKREICKLIFDETEKTILKNEVKREVIDGEPSDVIVDESEKYDLVVMGTHGRGGIKKFLLGSNAENVAQHISTSILLVRGN